VKIQNPLKITLQKQMLEVRSDK